MTTNLSDLEAAGIKAEATNKISSALVEWRENVLQQALAVDPSLGVDDIDVRIIDNKVNPAGQQQFNIEVVRVRDGATLNKSSRVIDLNAIFNYNEPVERNIMTVVSVEELTRLRERDDWVHY